MQIRHVLAVALLLAAAACGSNDSNPSPAPSSTGTTTGGTTTGGTTGGTTTGTTTTVSIPAGASVLTTTAYSPGTVTIKAGDSVNWVNNDNVAHTSTSNNGTGVYNITIGSASKEGTKQFLVQQNWVNASGGFCAKSF